MRLRSAMLRSMTQQNGALIVSFCTGIVIARTLTPAEVGSFTVALAAANLTMALKDFGIASYVISRSTCDTSLLRSAFGLSIVISTLVAIGLICLSWPLSSFYNDNTLGDSLRIVASAQMASTLGFPSIVLLTRAMRFDALLIVGLASALCQSVVSIVLATSGLGALSLAWGFLAAMVATTVLSVCFEPDGMRLRPRIAGAKQLLSFGSWMSAALFTGSAAMSAPELMIGRGFGLAEAALFTRAQNIISIIRNGIYVAIARPILPRLGACEREGRSVTALYLQIVESVTGVAWPAYAIICIWAEPLITMLYGRAWGGASKAILPLALAHALSLAVTPHYEILITKRRMRLLFLSELSVCLFTIVALAIALNFSPIAAAWSLTCSGAYFVVWYFVILKSVLKFPSSALFSVWGKSLVLTAAVASVSFVFRYIFLDTYTEVILGFAASCALAALVWCISLKLIGHELELHRSAIVAKTLDKINRCASNIAR